MAVEDSNKIVTVVKVKAADVVALEETVDVEVHLERQLVAVVSTKQQTPEY